MEGCDFCPNVWPILFFLLTYCSTVLNSHFSWIPHEQTLKPSYFTKPSISNPFHGQPVTDSQSQGTCASAPSAVLNLDSALTLFSTLHPQGVRGAGTRSEGGRLLGKWSHICLLLASAQARECRGPVGDLHTAGGEAASQSQDILQGESTERNLTGSP